MPNKTTRRRPKRLRAKFRPLVTIQQILEWADAHFERTGRWAENRPYYNVWPAAERALTRLRLDAVDSGQIVDGAEDALLQTRTFSIEPGKSVEEALGVPADESDATTDLSKADEFFRPAIRLLCTLCLPEQDQNLIEPDVLADDRRRYEETRDAALVARAVRRGKRGWNIGAHLDVSPHWRRPRFALRWTGPSGKVPRIVPVKGAIVRLHALTQVPTGTMADDDGIADED